MKILPKQKLLVNMKYQLVLFEIESMIERLLLRLTASGRVEIFLKKCRVGLRS